MTPMEMTAATKRYLGDGLYVEFDGFLIRLSAPRENGEHEVFLEPEVLRAFQRWIVDLNNMEMP